jgi:hypothetical protein
MGAKDDLRSTIRSTLNKLTVEKFPRLSQQLANLAVKSDDVIVLVAEVFEMAAHQHHFIDMYADLCKVLHDHYLANPINSDSNSKGTFGRLLLSQCQESLVRGAQVPPDSSDEAARMCKTRVLGNIMLIGSLCVRAMLAGKVVIALMEDMVMQRTPEAVESLAALLNIVGSTLDTSMSKHYSAFNAVFAEVEILTQQPYCHARSRCLLYDVLDRRAEGWRNIRPKRMDDPATLAEVEERQLREDGVQKERAWTANW